MCASEVLVLVDFEGTMEDELTVHAGDVVKNVTASAEEGWLVGELRGKRGIVPSNFVKEVPNYLTGDSKREPRSMRKLKMPKEQCRKCEVAFAYTPTNEDELELIVGETIEILREIEDGWWMGKKHGKIGAFPSNFVKEIISPKGLLIISEAVFMKECCQVMFDYAAIAEDEMNLKKGDFITIISKVTDDEGWWEGELNGQRGFFPDNFVMVIPMDTLQVSGMEKSSHTSSIKISLYMTVKQASGMEKSSTEASLKTETIDGKLEGKDFRSDPPGKIKLPGLFKPSPPPVKDKPHKPGNGDEQPPASPKHPESKAKDPGQFDGVDVSSVKLSHPTANRAKPPQRRPPTSLGTVPADDHQNEVSAEPDAAPQKCPVPPKHLSTTASISQHPTPSKTVNEVKFEEEKPTLDQVLADLKELRIALELFKTRHNTDMQDLKNELNEERNKRMKLQDEVQLLKKQN
uniref:SH3 domain-containing protein n=1 Tax=Electrophorus electricus TaxID=8005 RepID=A0A4W4EQF5_ELEEL